MSTRAYTRETGRPRQPRTALVIEVFVAGANGVIGTEVVSQPAAAGHDMIGVTRSPAKTDMLRALGARPVVADALDPDAVARAVAETEPK
jgi:nucleoside-diphosphate-sugar epimerase